MSNVIFKLFSFHLLGIASLLFGQQKNQMDVNTIFICIDSVSYQNIFKNPFIRNSLFACREQTTKTTEESYTGKYAIGKSATLEFFQPVKENKFGNHLGDFGIEFKTRKLGTLNTLIANVKKPNSFKEALKTVPDDQEKPLPWYKEYTSGHENYELSILEYQKEYLESLDFSASQINTAMTFSEFNEKLSNGKKYPRLFDQLKSIELIIGKNDLEKLKEFSEFTGLTASKNQFSNSDFSIKYRIDKNQKGIKVQKISFSLLSSQKERTIKVSDKIVFRIQKQQAEIQFK